MNQSKNEVEVKLPKQWRHWCASMHMRPHQKIYDKSQYNWFYLKGRGYVWRVNCYAEFQRGDNYEDFDRWALCSFHSVSIPKTLAEFKATVLRLVKEAEDDKRAE
jgi:hypothetical protein